MSREINRNGGHEGYRVVQADQAAWDRSHRPKQCKLSSNLRLARVVAKKLKTHWSPQQIAGWLKRKHSEREHYQVSHETTIGLCMFKRVEHLKKSFNCT